MASLSARSNRLPLLLAFAAVYLIWGSTYLAIRLAIESMPPLLMAGTRFTVAGALLFAALRLRGAPAPTWRGWGVALLTGTALLSVGNGGIVLGEQYIASGLAALLVATVPMLLAGLGWLSGQTARPSGRVAAGLGLGLAGVYLLARTASPSPVARPGHQALGVACVLAAALVWACGSLFARQRQAAPSPFLAGSMQMLAGGVLLVVAGLVRNEAAGFALGAVTLKSWLAFAYLVTCGSLIAFTAYNWLLTVVSPALAGTYAFINPVVAVFLGWALAGETLTLPMLGGAALVVGAVVAVVVGAPAKPR